MQNGSDDDPDTDADGTGTGPSKSYEGTKILYVDSYHSGYAWSDGVAQGIDLVLNGTGVEFKEVEMDTKNNPGEAFKISAAQAAKEEIDAFDPDVLIVSDDNAFKYLVKEYYRDASLPVVFCGVNWDISVYDGPYTNTAGMVEVALIEQLINHLDEYAAGNRVGYLAANVTSAIKEGTYYKQLANINLTERYVDTFEDWKHAFDEIQTAVDLLIVGNNAGITDWNAAAARSYAETHTLIPTGCIYDFMAEYSLLAIAKSAAEQGEWSARAALEIVDGATPSSIGVVQNQRGVVMLNLNIADALDVKLDPVLIKYAREIID